MSYQLRQTFGSSFYSQKVQKELGILISARELDLPIFLRLTDSVKLGKHISIVTVCNRVITAVKVLSKHMVYSTTTTGPTEVSLKSTIYKRIVFSLSDWLEMYSISSAKKRVTQNTLKSIFHRLKVFFSPHSSH